MTPGQYWRESRNRTTSEWEFVGYAGVDAGMVVIADPGYLIGEPIEAYRDWGKFVAEHVPHINEEGFSNVMVGDKHIGGVVMQSGRGDGCYDIYVQRNSDGQIVAAQIRFDDVKLDQ